MAKVDLIGKSQQQLSLYRHFGETVAKFQFQLSHFQIRTIGSELFLNSASRKVSAKPSHLWKAS